MAEPIDPRLATVLDSFTVPALEDGFAERMAALVAGDAAAPAPPIPPLPRLRARHGRLFRIAVAGGGAVAAGMISISAAAMGYLGEPINHAIHQAPLVGRLIERVIPEHPRHHLHKPLVETKPHVAAEPGRLVHPPVVTPVVVAPSAGITQALPARAGPFVGGGWQLPGPHAIAPHPFAHHLWRQRLLAERPLRAGVGMARADHRLREHEPAPADIRGGSGPLAPPLARPAETAPLSAQPSPFAEQSGIAPMPHPALTPEERQQRRLQRMLRQQQLRAQPWNRPPGGDNAWQAKRDLAPGSWRANPDGVQPLPRADRPEVQEPRPDRLGVAAPGPRAAAAHPAQGDSMAGQKPQRARLFGGGGMRRPHPHFARRR